VISSSDDQNDLPEAESSLMNYPNPFNPETEISFSLANPASVNLSIYSIKGQHIITLVNRVMESGEHSVKWYSRDETGKLVNSGIYLAKLKYGKLSQEIKMLLLK
jgi:flagellar hook assembly protein FlgD